MVHVRPQLSQDSVARMTLLMVTAISVVSAAPRIAPAHTTPMALLWLAAPAVFGGLTWAFCQGWKHAGPLAMIALALLIGWCLPEPYVTTYAPAVVVVPVMAALLVASPAWTLGTGVAVILTLLARAGFAGASAEPATIFVMLLITAMAVLSRVLIENARQEARSLARNLEVRVAERTAALAAQTARAQRLLEAKRDLYSTVAHDLRHDLTLATGLTHLLVQAIRAGNVLEAEEYEELLMRVIRRQGSYATDLLDVSMLAEGQTLPLRPARVDLEAIAANLADELLPEAEPYGIVFAVESHPSSTAAWCDPQRVERVLRNLLGNAIKAVKRTGEGGTITVRVRSENGMVRCDVADRGIGIAPEDLQRLGHRFVRARLPNAEGDSTGLGLTLSAQLVALMGGTLSLHSLGVGLGATATFTLPMCDTPEQLERLTTDERFAAALCADR